MIESFLRQTEIRNLGYFLHIRHHGYLVSFKRVFNLLLQNIGSFLTLEKYPLQKGSSFTLSLLTESGCSF